MGQEEIDTSNMMDNFYDTVNSLNFYNGIAGNVNLPEVTIEGKSPTGSQYKDKLKFQSYRGRNHFYNGIKEAKPLALGLVGLTALPGIIAVAPAVSATLSNPYVDAALTVDGVRNALSEEGVQKTYRLAKEGDYWGATRSGVADALDLWGGANMFKKGFNLAKQVVNPYPSNVVFIRNIGEVPDVDVNGQFWLSPQERAFSNMTWDKSFRTHRRYKNRPGSEYLIIKPESLKGERFLSTEPMDSFIKNRTLNANEVTLISGNPETRRLASERGFKTLSSPEVDMAYSEIPFKDNIDESSRFSLIKDEPYRSQEAIRYDDEVNKLIQSTYGKPNFIDAFKLRQRTGLSPKIYGFFNLKYDQTPSVEYDLLKKYDINPHPMKSDVSDDTINTMLNDLNSRKL